MPAAMPLDSATRRWAALALRRHDYYLELLKSGRWTHYFTEQEFAQRLRDVIAATRGWNGLANAAPAPKELERDTRSAA